MLTLNGIGLGHVMRTRIVSQWLCDLGEKPVVFVQGNYPELMRRAVPGGNLPRLHTMDASGRSKVASVLSRYVALSEPSILIEDTHPAPLDWPYDMPRAILMRPTVMSHMRVVRYAQRTSHVPVLLCDHPQSPTWPFSERETSEILSWPLWECIGPVFRRPSDDAMQHIRVRHGIDERQPLYVAFMGGGGQQEGSDDLGKFRQYCSEVGEQLRVTQPDARLLFLGGPLYPINAAAPRSFELIREEDDVPSLLALARGAIVRPGYNTVWECIAAGCPFLPVIGSTYQEPVAPRLDAIRKAGFPLCTSADDLLSDKTGATFRSLSQSVLVDFPDAPPAGLRKLLTGLRARPRNQEPWSWHRERTSTFGEGKSKLRLRIDDVVSLTPGIKWLLDGLRERQLKVSLEVIPYLADLTGAELDRQDLDGLVEVSQHGYAHIPHGLGWTRWGEFNHQAREPSDVTVEELRQGFATMRHKFGARFRGGYSAPYDYWTSWIVAVWLELGGRYVSWVDTQPVGPLPSIRAGMDPWNWSVSQAREPAQLSVAFHAEMRQSGSAGLVLHPVLLENQGFRSVVTRLIDEALAHGASSSHLSDITHDCL